jgi:hypothetical protein
MVSERETAIIKVFQSTGSVKGYYFKVEGSERGVSG